MEAETVSETLETLSTHTRLIAGEIIIAFTMKTSNLIDYKWFRKI
jgi:hypothetical protein